MNRLAAVVLLTATVAWAGGEPTPDFTVYLVRHAEKTAQADDPALTPAGEARARRFAEWMGGRGIQAVYASDYRRTRDTAAPVAQALGVAVETYDPRQLESLASHLRDRGETALVVGHSNTTPQLAALLCGCDAPGMDESVYDRIYVVTVTGDHAWLDVLTQPES